MTDEIFQHDNFEQAYRLLEKLLPQAVRRCAENYQHCLTLAQGDTAKEIKDYHSAAKAAVAHLAALVKLMDAQRKNDNASNASPPTTTIEAMLAHTRQALIDKLAHDPHDTPATQNQL